MERQGNFHWLLKLGRLVGLRRCLYTTTTVTYSVPSNLGMYNHDRLGASIRFFIITKKPKECIGSWDNVLPLITAAFWS